ncbi:MAG: serine/threonine protein kinase, partial [Deltaproteobacteria bacterium]
MAAEPSQFGPYELISRLGAGGMAETFLAVRRGPGGFEQRVCLKRILPAFEDDAEFVRLFMEEARIAATLRHANIVQVLDFGVANGSHFMALELIDGLDLRELLRALRKMGENITTGLVAHLAYELANALEYAHRADGEGQVQGVV